MPSCASPYILKSGDKVPCGKCLRCTARQISGWSFRLQKEAESSDSAFFITLTYDTDHVPISPNGFMTLDKRDVQLFMKRLRKAHTQSTKLTPQDKKQKRGPSGPGAKKSVAIRYYAAGEYGSKTHRPHYHIIIFNINKALVEACWKKGSIDIGTVTAKSCAYTLKYISKRQYRRKYGRDDRQAEFSLMSKKLGRVYVTDKIARWHKADLTNRVYLQHEGKKLAMPRYFKELIYTIGERDLIACEFKNKHFLEECGKTMEQKYQEADDLSQTLQQEERKHKKQTLKRIEI